MKLPISTIGIYDNLHANEMNLLNSLYIIGIVYIYLHNESKRLLEINHIVDIMGHLKS